MRTIPNKQINQSHKVWLNNRWCSVISTNHWNFGDYKDTIFIVTKADDHLTKHELPREGYNIVINKMEPEPVVEAIPKQLKLI